METVRLNYLGHTLMTETVVSGEGFQGGARITCAHCPLDIQMTPAEVADAFAAGTWSPTEPCPNTEEGRAIIASRAETVPDDPEDFTEAQRLGLLVATVVTDRERRAQDATDALREALEALSVLLAAFPVTSFAHSNVAVEEASATAARLEGVLASLTAPPEPATLEPQTDPEEHHGTASPEAQPAADAGTAEHSAG